MRIWLRILIGILALALLAAGAWAYFYRRALTSQWHCYRVAAAGSYAAAEKELTWFEQGPDSRQRLAELVEKWGTGTTTFDLYLVRYVSEGQSSEALRRVFSQELGRRAGLLERWAHYWAYQAPIDPGRQLASVVEYFETLAAADVPPASVTWREVLDLQAAFFWTARPELAAGLTPENWPERFRRWQRQRPRPLPRIGRPARALPGAERTGRNDAP